jgi:hypothetical protein
MPTTCADVVGRLCHLSTTDAEKASPVTPCPLKWLKGAQWGAALGKGSVGRPLAMGRKQPILRPQQISLESQGKKKIPHVQSPTRSVSGQGGAQSSPQAASGCRRRSERCGGHRTGRGLHLLARQLGSPPAGLGEVELGRLTWVKPICAGQPHGGAGDPR